MLPFCCLLKIFVYIYNMNVNKNQKVMMLELNVEECLEYLKNFQDPKAECERKISEMARASIKDPTETSRQWSHERMKQYVEAYYILKKNEN